ncbi:MULTISPECIES: DUF4124 domain-containing protein [Vibrio]|uniref:DUF4124 domain-containing protein n=1 Tax=Vibrio TaxID=662 RepID=UPI001482CF49|nr:MULTISPECIES: DUF4124 domain-containing protein [Vibrio]EGR0024289.1 DUF4124 domain-containing protein [Vibrio alginolyticus]EHC9867623.1 DUF4124 domain-containing protein [Vibrio alginolyticus]EJS0323385.1 DUF4124 domain-containing protein [Vibrio alginolyticus]ELA7354222.1 DUF4124 domain-containing protein [Vibrio alginolyticus]ELB2847433.1 DUF4124 domain-containing protein [Vibrio alginolyticus]
MKVQLIPSLCALSGLLIASIAFAQVAYTWVDENGVVHFSDTPNKGAKAIALPNLEASAPAPEVESTESLAPQTTPSTASQNKPEKTTEKPLPLQLSMLTPKHNETIRSNRGIINIQLETNRKLGIGEQLQLLLDGKPYGAPQNHIVWQLNNIDRGTHTLAVHAKRSGKLIASTSPITVHLHKASVKPTVKGAK